MAKKETAKFSFEQSLQRLEQIVESLEEGEVSLEESLSMYEEGIELSKKCMETLSKAELKVQQLSKDISGKIEMKDFE
ncbi:MAG: exodeoxyribonuclease VII small subunit [Bacteroidetes bacterium]|nr:exodeoxyribonuclease VII small subunit [Bacteroidota bacterium]